MEEKDINTIREDLTRLANLFNTDFRNDKPANYDRWDRPTREAWDTMSRQLIRATDFFDRERILTAALAIKKAPSLGGPRPETREARWNRQGGPITDRELEEPEFPPRQRVDPGWWARLFGPQAREPQAIFAPEDYPERLEDIEERALADLRQRNPALALAFANQMVSSGGPVAPMGNRPARGNFQDRPFEFRGKRPMESDAEYRRLRQERYDDYIGQQPSAADRRRIGELIKDHPWMSTLVGSFGVGILSFIGHIVKERAAAPQENSILDALGADIKASYELKYGKNVADKLQSHIEQMIRKEQHKIPGVPIYGPFPTPTLDSSKPESIRQDLLLDAQTETEKRLQNWKDQYPGKYAEWFGKQPALWSAAEKELIDETLRKEAEQKVPAQKWAEYLSGLMNQPPEVEDIKEKIEEAVVKPEPNPTPGANSGTGALPEKGGPLPKDWVAKNVNDIFKQYKEPPKLIPLLGEYEKEKESLLKGGAWDALKKDVYSDYEAIVKACGGNSGKIPDLEKKQPELFDKLAKSLKAYEDAAVKVSVVQGGESDGVLVDDGPAPKPGDLDGKGKKKKKAKSDWISHVKKYSKEHGVPFFAALGPARASYKGGMHPGIKQI